MCILALTFLVNWGLEKDREEEPTENILCCGDNKNTTRNSFFAVFILRAVRKTAQLPIDRPSKLPLSEGN